MATTKRLLQAMLRQGELVRKNQQHIAAVCRLRFLGATFPDHLQINFVEMSVEMHKLWLYVYLIAKGHNLVVTLRSLYCSLYFYLCLLNVNKRIEYKTSLLNAASILREFTINVKLVLKYRMIKRLVF